MAYQNIPTKVLTGEVRLSYANLTKPRASQQGGEEKYSVTLLIPKTDAATHRDILSSIEAAAKDAQGKLWNGVRPPVLPTPLHDGDGVKENGTPYGAECKGHWVMTASSKNKPEVMRRTDIGLAEVPPQEIYSGMRALVTVNFFGYNSNGKRGVGCGLGNVLKTRDDEPLSGGASAEVDFANVAVPAYAAPQYAPDAPQQRVPYLNPLTGQPYSA
jgi:hypothetical protein